METVDYPFFNETTSKYIYSCFQQGKTYVSVVKEMSGKGNSNIGNIKITKTTEYFTFLVAKHLQLYYSTLVY